MIKLNPKNYIKLFYGKESVFLSSAEIRERQRMAKDGFSNVELIYLDGQWFFSKKDLAKYYLSDQEIVKVINLIDKRAREYVAASKKYRRSFVEASWPSLVKSFKECYRLWGNYLRIIDISVYASYHFEKKLINSLLRFGLTNKEFDALTYPLSNTYNQRRKKDLLLLRSGQIKKSEFKTKWAWSNIELAAFKTVDDFYLKEQLAAIKNPKKELAEMEKQHQNSEKRYFQIYKKLPAGLKKQAEISQRLLYIRDFRFEQFLRGIYNFYPLFKELGRRLGLSCDELIHLKPQEVMAKKIPVDLTLRQKRYVNIKNNIYTGEPAAKIYQLFNRVFEKKDQVSGKGVSAGIVRGIAKVVLSTAEFNKVKKGDIIVCEITMPDYMPVLHKVSAIVADIGGFTSHSAIVARELKIPCVVGTEIATKVFKDGDRIEVDADEGIIRKIK
ncbi:MAG: PEP-utilizing enzyme [Patescibacteria group bacterium]|jgi:phosphohistidine swiveling domain-containing protein